MDRSVLYDPAAAQEREREIDIQKDAKCVIDLFISLCYCNVHTKDIVFLPASDKSHAGNGFGVGWPFRIGDTKRRDPLFDIGWHHENWN